MKLYYFSFACSFAVNIALREAGITFTMDRVDNATKTTASGLNFLEVNPNGYVPVLELDDGTRLTEVNSILQYVADLAPEKGLAPKAGTFERTRLQEMLGFVSTELHKSFGSLFNAKANEEFKTAVKETLAMRFSYIDGILSRQPYLLGEQFTVADAYLYAVLGWTRYVGIDLAPWPSIQAFQVRAGERPAVQEATKAEKQKV